MPTYKKTPSSMRECVGAECPGCSSANCYAEGGSVGSGKNRHDFERGVHKPSEEARRAKKVSQWEHRSEAGGHVNEMISRHYADADDMRENEKLKNKAVDVHHKTLGQMHSMKKPKLYAEGGAVDSWTKREDNEKGVHQPFSFRSDSKAGHSVRSSRYHESEEEKQDHLHAAKREHHKKLGELKMMKKPHLYAGGGEVHDDVPEPDPKKAKEFQQGVNSGGTSASDAWKNLKSGLGFAEGGEVADGEPEMDAELKHAMGGEFMDAMERKDRKGIMSALEAIVLSCRRKE